MSARMLRSVMIPVVLATLLMPGTATSESVKPGNLTRISGESPFREREGCDPLDPTPFAMPEDAEAEVSLAVNPANPKNMVAAWMQDGARGIVTAATHDGGRSWTDPPTIVPGLTLCSGGKFVIAADPWLSIGPDGTVYLASFSLGPDRTRVQVNTSEVFHTSEEGELTWSGPNEVFGGAVTAHDMPHVTADPTKDCFAYVAWTEQPNMFLLNPGGLAVMFSRTKDCGRSGSWSTVPTPVIRRNLDAELGNPEILVLSDGSLLLVVPSRNREELLYEVLVSRSEDGGETWSNPVTAAKFSPGEESFGTDPEPTGREECTVEGEPAPCPLGTARHWVSTDVAPAPDGTVHIAFHHQCVETAEGDPAQELCPKTKGGVRQIRVVSSTLGDAKEWERWKWKPTVVSEGTAEKEKFLPSLAVAGDGTVGVTYYDTRNDAMGDDEWTADVYFASLRDGGRKVKEQQVAGPFDLRTAMFFREELWVGEYHGLDGLPNGFAAAFALAEPFTTAGASDIFFDRIEPNRPPTCAGVTASPSVIAPANRDRFETITLLGASDPDGDALGFRIDGVSQDEPVSGAGIGDDTSPDAQVTAAGEDSNEVLVRAERNPQRNGRVYRIAYTVSDDVGASCSGTAGLDGDTTAAVAVPRMPGESAVDDGDTTSWNSFTGGEVSGTLP